MKTSFRLNEKELTDDIINVIRIAFKNKEIEITVSDFLDETEYLLSSEANKKHLQKSIADIENGEGITFTLNELEEKYVVK
jgi:antitoxin YefM